MLGALHLTMAKHFDMNELYQHLVPDAENRGLTRAFISNRPFARAATSATADALRLRQRSFLFVFKYYTVVGEGLEPAAWQKFDKRPMNRRSVDHIDIAECGSVLALSLGGEPLRKVTLKQRRTQGDGVLFDTFAPWHLLTIQAFPDDEHTVREPGARKTFCNGPEAFLDALVLEYKDATKRNQILHDRITKLITPPVRSQTRYKPSEDVYYRENLSWSPRPSLPYYVVCLSRC